MVKVIHKGGSGAKELMERIKELSSQKVCVGVPHGSNRANSNVSNADLAYIHTNGVRPKPVRAEMQKEIDKGTKYSIALQMYIKEHGSFAMQVPARPIIQPAIEHNEEEIGELLGDTVKVAANGGDTKQALSNVGNTAQNDVREWFTDPKNGWAPNAPSTIKKKHSDKPLIDTGELRKSITFVIRGDNDD